MSFWDLSDGDAANENAKSEYEIPGGNMDPIPNNSDVLAGIAAAKWAKKDDKRLIEIQWKVKSPQAFANRVVFQKLWVADLDPQAKDNEKAVAKRDKARRMLATIDLNAKGRLMKSNDMPSDDDLALALVDAEMVIKCMIWEINDRATGEKAVGNWVSAVKGKDAELTIGEPMKKSEPTGGGGLGLDDGDDIPFAPEFR